MIYRHWGKRFFDLAIAMILFILLTPAYGIVAVLVRVKLGRPVHFRQWRPGINGTPFVLRKFRTMLDAREDTEECVLDIDRLIPLGRKLRQLSLDELPELTNVLIGDMSLVGPRPLLMEYLELYSPEQARRHEVKPGITGWAQVNGRNAIGWERKFDLDVWYVDHLSFCLDMKIIGLTIWKIIKRESINQPGQATMEKFQGTGGKHGG
jgi:sugar transferase EpsL